MIQGEWKQGVKVVVGKQFPAKVTAMTNPKHVKHYPPEFLGILKRLDEDPTVQIRLECGNSKLATAMRKQLYDFRNAVESDPGLLEMYPAAPSLMVVTYQNDANVLVVVHRDHSPSAAIVREALEKLDGKKS